MNDVLRNVQQKDAYDDLPESIKSVYSKTEWLWLTDDEKARLVSTETEPEW